MYPQILGIGTANPPIRLTQEQSYYTAGYTSERIRNIFPNSDIEYPSLLFWGNTEPRRDFGSTNERYLSGAMKTGCSAIMSCREVAEASVKDIDFLAIVHAPVTYVQMW